MIFIPNKMWSKKKARCTTRVMAQCVRFHYSTNGYCTPVYRFKYNGAEKEVKDSVYKYTQDIQVGQQRELLVNLKVPDEFIVVGQKKPLHVRVLTAIGAFYLSFFCIILFFAILIMSLYWLSVS